MKFNSTMANLLQKELLGATVVEVSARRKGLLESSCEVVVRLENGQTCFLAVEEASIQLPVLRASKEDGIEMVEDIMEMVEEEFE